MRDQVQGARRCVRDSPFDLVDALGKVAQGARHLRQVNVEHVADGFAHIQRFQQGELICMMFNQVGKSQQHLRPSPRGQAAPAAIVPGGECIGHGPVYIGRLTLGHLRQQLTVGRVDAVECAAVLGWYMLSIDKQPGGNGQGPGLVGPFLVTQGVTHGGDLAAYSATSSSG